ncbi:hypothetical protein ABK040_001012 [Willaertia magna]
MSSPSNLTIPSTSTTNDNTKAQKRVAIIGAGWYGCHLGLVLKNKGYKVTIFEKENDIFLGASGYNQFRLHKGLHYARSYITRVQALKGFDHFMKTYPELTTQADYNLYGIATKNSWLDFGTYKQVMDSSKIYNKEFNHTHFGLTNLEGSLICDERVLYHSAPRDYFKQKLKDELKLNTPVAKAEQIIVQSFKAPQVSPIDCDDEEEEKLSLIKINGDDSLIFDWCISCTYNSFVVTPSLNIFYEPCLTLIYKDIRSEPLPRVAMTICDGNFSSLFPYIRDAKEEQLIIEKYRDGKDHGDDVKVLYTLTSVAHTPLGQFNSWKKAEEKRLQVHNNPEEVKKLIPLFEQNILTFYPAFKQHFEYDSFFTSMKTKLYDSTDSRECTVEREGSFISIMSGKVNSLHVAEAEVLKILNEGNVKRKKKQIF